jgi:hypothetical protein
VSANQLTTTGYYLAKSRGPCGIDDTAYGFDARVKSYVKVPKTGLLAVQSFTFAVHIYPGKGGAPIFEYDVDSKYGSFGLRCWINGDEILTCNLKSKESSLPVLSGLTVANNAWSFVAVRLDKFTKSIFMKVNDKTFSKTFAAIGAELSTDGDLLFGTGQSAGTSEYFSGLMANLLMFDSALTESEIEGLKLKCPKGKHGKMYILFNQI